MPILSVVQKSILIFCACGFVSARRVELYESFFWFDLGLVLYILLYLFTGLLRNSPSIFISRFSLHFILFLLAVFSPALFLLPLTSNLEDSVKFLSQYFFLAITLPLFLDILYKNNQLKFFLSSLFLGLVIVLIFYMAFYLGISEGYFFSLNSESQLQPIFGNRFVIGEFTPNEMGHYFVFLMFLMGYNKKKAVGIVGSIPFILTLSKTVWVQILTYSLFFRYSFFRWVLLFLLVAYMFLYQPDLIRYFVGDFSAAAQSNSIRIEMYIDSFINIPNSIIFPAYHSVDNLKTEGLNVVSAHNGFLSFITNFGLVSFLILLGVVVLFVASFKHKPQFKMISFFIFLDLITIMFNPLINSRILWLPLFLYIFIIAKPKQLIAG